MNISGITCSCLRACKPSTLYVHAHQQYHRLARWRADLLTYCFVCLFASCRSLLSLASQLLSFSLWYSSSLTSLLSSRFVSFSLLFSSLLFSSLLFSFPFSLVLMFFYKRNLIILVGVFSFFFFDCIPSFSRCYFILSISSISLFISHLILCKVIQLYTKYYTKYYTSGNTKENVSCTILYQQFTHTHTVIQQHIYIYIYIPYTEQQHLYLYLSLPSHFSLLLFFSIYLFTLLQNTSFNNTTYLPYPLSLYLQ